MCWNIKTQKRLYELFLNAIYSDNTDYIKDQLSRIYTMIYCNNISSNVTEIKKLEEINVSCE